MKGFCKILLGNKSTTFFVVAWLVFQIIYCYFCSYDELISDPGFYVYNAQECLSRGTYFPDIFSYHSEYIFSPGYINLLIIWLKIFGDIELFCYFNVFCNAVILFLLYLIAKKLFNNIYVTNAIVLLFIAIPSNATIVLHCYTEIPFELLTLLVTFLVVFHRRRCIYYLCGILLALAQWIRPLSIGWFIAVAIYLLYLKDYKSIVRMTIGTVLTSLCIAVFTHQYFPDYLYKPVTGGVNLLMGANDKATGGYCGEARRNKDGLGYLPELFDSTSYTRVRYDINSGYVYKYSNKYTYKECDSIYKARSVQWIVKNPVRWLSLIPQKLYLTYQRAPVFAFTYNQIARDSLFIKIIGRISYAMSYLLFFVFCISFIGLFTKFWRSKEQILIVVPIIMGTAMTVATCGAARYAFIFIPNLLLFTSFSIINILTILGRNDILFPDNHANNR